tara:strand:- start:270 stop:488 length:219 start_codon:yes stop_codon:yes gene_type:complete
MANFRQVNKAIREATTMDIEAVRGDGYIYFDGDDGFDKIPSIYAHPTSISTEGAVRLCLEAINEAKEITNVI